MNRGLIFLRPVTKLYFGRPGALPAGEAHVGISWFPPPLSAFQGMIRTRLLDEAGVFAPAERVAQLVGAPDTLPPDWQLQGPFPCRPVSRFILQTWLPAPAMMLNPQERKATYPVMAKLMNITGSNGNDDLLMDRGVTGTISSRDTRSSGNVLELLGNPVNGESKPTNNWISSRNLFYLLQGNVEKWLPDECAAHFPPFVKQELQTGLAREKSNAGTGKHLSGRVAEGMLYTLSTLRFAPESGLCGWFSGGKAEGLNISALQRGTVISGKKSGVMAFEKQEASDSWWEKIALGEHLDIALEKKTPLLVWITLLTPGYWESIPKLKEQLSMDGLRVRVRGALCPPVSWLGGFSLTTRRPRAAMPWYSPRTSLLLEVEGKEMEEIVRLIRFRWNNRCILAPETKKPFGYGHILVGIYNNG